MMERLGVDIRFAAPDDAGVFTGYAAVFNEANGHREIVKPGAFARSLQEHMARGSSPMMFWQHRPDEPIGKWTALAEDARGLKVTGQLVLETQRGREAHALMKVGAMNGLSIGFRARGASRAPNGALILTDIDLVEISPVSLPSASGARVTGVRKAASPAGLTAFVEAARRAAQTLRG